MPALLSISGLTKSFGAIVVADDTSFDVVQGEAVGILGHNGAGKTSLFNLITGAPGPDAGRIAFAGQDISTTSPARRCKIGIARSFQAPIHPFLALLIVMPAVAGIGYIL